MSSSLLLGVLSAVVCALITNLAFLLKHRGAAAAPPVDARHPLRSAVGLFRSRWFSVGWLVAALAWIFHVGALALAPLSVVQVVLASGVAMLAVTAGHVFGFTVGRRQWIGLTAMAAGLGLITVTQPALHGSHSAYSPLAMAGCESALLALSAVLVLVPRMRGARRGTRGVALGTAAGVLFGVSDVAVKALTGSLGHPLGLLSPWLLVAAVASVSAFYTSARGLQLGDAVPVIALMGTAANLVGIAGGVVVFSDPLPGTPAGVAVEAAGFLLVVLAAALMPAPVRAARLRPATA